MKPHSRGSSPRRLNTPVRRRKASSSRSDFTAMKSSRIANPSEVCIVGTLSGLLGLSPVSNASPPSAVAVHLHTVSSNYARGTPKTLRDMIRSFIVARDLARLDSMTQPLAVPELTQTPKPERLLYDKREAAAMLSVSVRTIDYLIADKELPCIRIRGRVLLHRDALQAFAKGRRGPKVN